MATHLVIPDPHATPDHPNTRFDFLGKLILDRRPDAVICLGDWANMDSLCSYDKGKKSFEGRRWLADVEASHDANRRLMAPLREYNNRKRELKEKQYRPSFYMLGGNHDDGRISKVVQDSPEYEGLVDIDALDYEGWGWEYIPFKENLELDGVTYCHYQPSGVMGNPISGFNIGRLLLNKLHKSCTVGHSHLWSEATDMVGDSRRIWGLSAGCYLDYTPTYATHVKKWWWAGAVLKHGVRDGDYDMERLSLRKLTELYGSTE